MFRQAVQATPPSGQQLMASGWARTLEDEEEPPPPGLRTPGRSLKEEEVTTAGPANPKTVSTEEALASSPILGGVLCFL